MDTIASVKALSKSIATSATGYGVVLDGVLDINSIGETASVAASNAMAQRGFVILSNCRDITCDCKVGVLAQLIPNAKVVAVAVAVLEE